MKKISLLRQYEMLADTFCAILECPNCGRLKNKGYVCLWDDCPGEPE